jgi:hypothetical protein
MKVQYFHDNLHLIEEKLAAEHIDLGVHPLQANMTVAYREGLDQRGVVFDRPSSP